MTRTIDTVPPFYIEDYCESLPPKKKKLYKHGMYQYYRVDKIDETIQIM